MPKPDPLHTDGTPPPLRRDRFGVIRIAGTRVSLESLVVAHEEGASVEDLADSFPDLTLPDIHAAIDYSLRHRDEVEEYIEERRRQAREAEERLRADFPEVYREVRSETGSP